MKRVWVFCLGIALLGTSCIEEAIYPQVLLVGLDSRDAYDAGYERSDPRFELSFSETDAIVLGLSDTTFEETDLVVFEIETKYRDRAVAGPAQGPCLADDVVVVNLDTGEAFVAIEAGHCMEYEWQYLVIGAFDYLTESGPCTGKVTLDDGRELAVVCR